MLSRKKYLNASSQFKYLYLSMVLVCLIASCQIFSKEKKEDKLVVKYAFVQKEIPGQQDAKIRTYLNLKFETLSDQGLTMETITYQNKIYSLDANKLNYKIDLSKETSRIKNSSNLSKGAIIHYKRNNKQKELSIPIIEQKEDLYLP